jgi:hypothetical protein
VQQRPETKVFLLLFLQKKKILVLFLTMRIFTLAVAPQGALPFFGARA